MSGKRNITKEDILLRDRMNGAGTEVKGPLLFKPIGSMASNGIRIVLDETDLIQPFFYAYPNPDAPMQVVIDGYDVTVSDEGEVVATGKLEEQPSWCDAMMTDGTTRVGDAILTNLPTEFYININNRCYAHDSGNTCRFCGMGPSFSQNPLWTLEDTLKGSEPMTEAIALAAKNGWRGTVLLNGGLVPPDRRGQWYTDVLEGTMERFRAILDDEEILGELQIAVGNCPPDDFGEYHKWKSFGISSMEIDTEVLHPDWFKAMCPAKDKRRWDEGQEAAAEVFGRGRGASNLFVLGIEPMAGMLEGVEERMSKGVFVMPAQYTPHPDAPMGGMGSPAPEWFQEAYEKILDIYFKYADTFDVDLTEDDRWGYTRRTKCLMPHNAMWISRLQEMGKLDPGLPSQYTAEPA